MAMSRKHYTETAAVIAAAVEDGRSIEGTARIIADGLACMFKADNSNFDRERFLTACGFGDPNGN